MLAAERAGVAVADFVAQRSARFAALGGPLQLSFDDFLRTSADPRHAPGVTALWRACAAAGDLYQRDYEGRYCVGCEAFLTEVELVGGRCPEHGTEPEVVAERNWFFRLSRYERAILERIEDGRLRIEPAHRRNEVLAFVRAGLGDISVSRSVARARGWGIRVPDDPAQVIYVWFDALGYYLSALGYGLGGEGHRTWWRDADRRAQVVGKGVIRFHAVYWPAFLLSAGEPLPSEILVHDYVTFAGEKLAKSASGAVAPVELVERYGTDALRWWCVRDVRRVGDTDFREELLVLRANELADDLRNLVNRVVSLLDRLGADRRSSTPRLSEPVRALSLDTRALPARVDTAVARFDLREASTAIAQLATHANRLISLTRPWELARAADAGDAGARDELDGVLETVTTACETLARELSPFLPGGAARIEQALAHRDGELARRLFVKAEVGRSAG